MKKIFSLVSLACAVMLLPSCTSDLDVAEVESPSTASDMVEVSLNMGGDFLSMTETPITRAGANKKTFFAVNVLYAKNEDAVKANKGEGQYDPYAYGLFDDPSQMVIKLSNQFTYKFECTIVQEDYNEIYFGTNDKGETFYSYPFIDCATFLNSSNNEFYQKKLDATLAKNTFRYSHDLWEQETNQVKLNAIQGGLAYVKLNPDAITLKERATTSVDDKNNTVGHFVGNMKETIMSGLMFAEEWFQQNNGTKEPKVLMYTYAKLKYPGVDRWYGELKDYKTSDGPVLNIDMKRTGFGVQFVVTPPADGKLYISCNDMMFAQVTPTTGVKVIESMFSYEKVYRCWNYAKENKDYDMKDDTKAKDDDANDKGSCVFFNFTRVRADGSKQTFVMPFNPKRNNIYTINVDAEKMVNSGFALSTTDDLPTYQTINAYE